MTPLTREEVRAWTAPENTPELRDRVLDLFDRAEAADLEVGYQTGLRDEARDALRLARAALTHDRIRVVHASTCTDDCSCGAEDATDAYFDALKAINAVLK